jgi:hypothetical protein
LATSVNTSLPLWLTGQTYDGSGGSDLRNSHVTATYLDTGIMSGSAIGVRGGVIGGAGLVVAAASGMNVTVQPGSFVVPNTTSPVSGGYSATLAQSATLAVQAASPSNRRIDIVVANVTDNGNSTSSGQVQIITGTPAASPAPPSAPANSITLAQVTVPASATSVTAGNIKDTRPFTTTTGGVLKAAPGTVTGYDGQAAYDAANKRFYHNTNLSGGSQFRILPWAPAYVTRNASFGLAPGTLTNITSLNITTDGLTDIKITYHVTGIYQPNNTGPRQVVFAVFCDGNQLSEIDLQTNTDDLAGISHSGFTDVYTTSSLAGDTPSAGTHTIYLKGMGANTVGSGDIPWVRATPARNTYLRVEPAVL